MRCHYEVLGVSQRATDSDLKKAYRQMALVWHPDKNPDNMEEAKVQFQLIQAAYDTLSDPQERAFYDRNRESILRGKASGSDPKPETVDLFEYFSSQCYSGFNDSEKGFYTIYRQVFEKIAAKDMQYMDDEEEIIIPDFGSSDTDLEDVAEFYGYWSSYCTSMDFHWADEFDIREAQRMGRWVEKKIEKDNNKARQKARRQFNEEVRALVAFVRKRDKRWLARKKIIEAKIVENAQKQEAAQRRQREARQMKMKEDIEQEKANLAAYEDELKAMEEKFANEWGLTESDSDDDLEEDEVEINELREDKGDLEESEERLLDNLYCVACNRYFKTEKSKESHERSKKHKENLERLKATMFADEELYFTADCHDSKTVKDNSQSEEDVAEQPRSSKKKKKMKKKAATEELTDSPVSESIDKRKKSKRKNRQSVDELEINVKNFIDESESKTESDLPVINGHDEANEQNKEISAQVESEEEIDKNEKNEDADSTPLDNKDKKTERTKLEPDSRERYEKPETKPKLKGKKAKEARKQAREANNCVEQDVQVNKCTICGNMYPSKNKLFSHIKAEGHAALKTLGKEVKGKNKAKN
ncbi:dnaJ homolog subfamily C member 21 [Cherax quadricarinatus]